jgi:hypothetical protein
MASGMLKSRCLEAYFPFSSFSSTMKQIFSNDELVAKPIFAPPLKLTSNSIVEPIDPFDLLQRVVALPPSSSSSSSTDIAVPARPPPPPVPSRVTLRDDDELGFSLFDDEPVYSAPAAGASSDEEVSDHEIENDGRSDNERPGEQSLSKRVRYYHERWYTKTMPSPLPVYRAGETAVASMVESMALKTEVAQQLLPSLISFPDDDVLSIYVAPLPSSTSISLSPSSREVPLSSAIEQLLVTYATQIEHVAEKLRSGGYPYYFAPIIERKVATLQAKQSYLNTLLSSRAGSDWRCEIDRLGDAKDGATATKPSPGFSFSTTTSNGSPNAGNPGITTYGTMMAVSAASPPSVAATATARVRNGEIKTKEVKEDLFKSSKIMEDVMKQIMDGNTSPSPCFIFPQSRTDYCTCDTIAPQSQLYARMRGKFTGEPGSGDGPTREIFGVISKEFFGPRSPFFAPSPGTFP